MYRSRTKYHNGDIAFPTFTSFVVNPFCHFFHRPLFNDSEHTYTGPGRGPSWFKRYISDDKYSYAYYKELAKDVGYPHEIKDNIIGPFIK